MCIVCKNWIISFLHKEWSFRNLNNLLHGSKCIIKKLSLANSISKIECDLFPTVLYPSNFTHEGQNINGGYSFLKRE